MEKDWVVIAEFTDDVKCQMAIDLLLDNGIEAVPVDKRDRVYRFGEIEIYVHRDNVLTAKQVIKEL